MVRPLAVVLTNPYWIASRDGSKVRFCYSAKAEINKHFYVFVSAHCSQYVVSTCPSNHLDLSEQVWYPPGSVNTNTYAL